MQLYRDYFVCMAFPQPNCVPSVFWYDRNSGQVNSKTVQKRPCAATEVHKLWHKAHFFSSSSRNVPVTSSSFFAQCFFYVCLTRLSLTIFFCL